MAYIGIKDLCKPAMLYLIMSMVAIFMIGFQNIGNTNTYCVGNYSCSTPSVVAIFLLKIIYVLFWTWILNILCKSGFEVVSWVLVLLPFIFLFVILAWMMLSHADRSRYMW